ncbi:hypothetical protein MVEN_00148000 [Mycena venus]|uniref:LysM domain-containing protein n=1 Tax=Mycena venus TaxID=2733690 RepID=A0A8H6Z1Q3_9AGAR|nr:hypothetical protein MVEN_00148000 [Mycena venus]
MVFSKVFAPLFAMVLATVVTATPVAAPEANALFGITKRACTQTYTVVGGDTCAAIESKTGVSDAQLHQLNPGINSGCTNLQIGQALCLSGGTSGGGCSQTYTVVSGDTCAVIESKTGVSDAQLHAQNPAINSGCTNLQIGQTLCISGGSGSTGGGGGGCLQTYTVVSGDTCAVIESKTGISDAQLHAQNPAINSACTNLQVGQTLCVSGGSGSNGGGGGTTFTAIASFYDPDGGIGACGTVLQNSDFVVALGVDTWDNGAHCGGNRHCGMYASCHKGASISVIVADRCAGCNDLHGPNSIDLSEGAIAALDSNYEIDGLINVQWTLF